MTSLRTGRTPAALLIGMLVSIVSIVGLAPAPAWAQAPVQVLPRTKPSPSATLPGVELSQELMYNLMMGEIALQRGQPQVAVQTFLDVARQTRDPRVAQRATEMAWNARMQKEALEAASIWQKADPASQQARQVMAALLVNQEQLGDARPHLEQWLAADKANIAPNFVQLAQLLGRNKDKKGVLELLRALAHRQKLQLRLQQAVEGLSVVAISYYALGLVGYLAKALKDLPAFAAWRLQPDVVVGVFVLPVILGAAWFMRRLRRVTQ